MEQGTLRDFEYRCIQEEMPLCRAACPLQVDVRAFMTAMAASDENGARKILERHMPLPGLMAQICDHPCEQACLRETLGGSLAVGDLEKFCAARTSRQTKPLPIPRKHGSAAVIGDDLAGLVAAWDLSRKGWSVTVYMAEASPGAALLRRLEPDRQAGLRAVLDDELEFMQRGPVVLEPRALTRELLAEALSSFGAVFVDAAAAPDLALPRAQVDPVTLLGEQGACVCHGGWREGDSPVTQAAEGRRAAATLDRILTGVSLTASREKEGITQSRLKTPVQGLMPLPRESGPYTTPEHASAEAARCLRCECMACVRECAYLAHYQGYPKIYARQAYNNASIVKGQHLANALINGCSLCGQCREICPERFSMADLCLASRREMVERGYMPPSAHEFALEDMAASNGPDCALMRPEPGQSTAAHLFFPGCQLAASRPEQVLAAYQHLREGLAGGVALALRCCGVPARWAGREDLFGASASELREQWAALGRPRIVAACASCLKVLAESQPDMEIVSLWQVLSEECPVPQSFLPRALTIQDPCSARHDKVWQGSVRDLLTRQGVTVNEPSFGGELTACCGYGGLTWNAQPAVASAMTAHRAAQLDGETAASCVMCRDRLVAAGKPCLYILDVLFPSVAVDPFLPGPGLSARRARRAALKQRVLAELWGEKVAEAVPESPRLFIDSAVLDKMEGRHILWEDVALVIRKAQAGEAPVFLDKLTSRFLASWRPVRVTYWVLYSPEADGFRVHGAYSHRMAVPGTGNVDMAPADGGFSGAFRPAAERGGR